MENIIIVNPNDFWDKHREITKQVIREELDKENLHSENSEDILVIEDVCKLLKKSKQTNSLRRNVNEIITEIKLDGTLENIKDKWGIS